MSGAPGSSMPDTPQAIFTSFKLPKPSAAPQVAAPGTGPRQSPLQQQLQQQFQQQQHQQQQQQAFDPAASPPVQDDDANSSAPVREELDGLPTSRRRVESYTNH